MVSAVNRSAGYHSRFNVRVTTVTAGMVVRLLASTVRQLLSSELSRVINCHVSKRVLSRLSEVGCARLLIADVTTAAQCELRTVV